MYCYLSDACYSSLTLLRHGGRIVAQLDYHHDAGLYGDGRLSGDRCSRGPPPPSLPPLLLFEACDGALTSFGHVVELRCLMLVKVHSPHPNEEGKSQQSFSSSFPPSFLGGQSRLPVGKGASTARQRTRRPESSRRTIGSSRPFHLFT